MSCEVVRVGATYRHYAGARYVVLAVALESTNGRSRERIVVYQGEQLNVRTEREFLEWLPLAGCPRFKLCPPELWLPVPVLGAAPPASAESRAEPPAGPSEALSETAAQGEEK